MICRECRRGQVLVFLSRPRSGNACGFARQRVFIRSYQGLISIILIPIRFRPIRLIEPQPDPTRPRLSRQNGIESELLDPFNEPAIDKTWPRCRMHCSPADIGLTDRTDQDLGIRFSKHRHAPHPPSSDDLIACDVCPFGFLTKSTTVCTRGREMS